MKQKIKQFFTANEYRNVYVAIILIMSVSYYFVRQMFIDQSPWSVVQIAPLTINMLLLYFLWGYFIEKRLKSKSQTYRLSIDFAGFLIITLVFRFGFGMKSILG